MKPYKNRDAYYRGYMDAYLCRRPNSPLFDCGDYYRGYIVGSDARWEAVSGTAKPECTRRDAGFLL